MLMPANNPWATFNGLEAQRTDLWRLNFRLPLSYFSTLSTEQFSSLGLNKEKLPSASEASVYASQVSLPVQKLSSCQVILGTVPRNYPSYFSAQDSVRVSFRHDVGDQSRIMTMLTIWRAIVRTGRAGGSESGFLLQNETSKPSFEFDVGLEYLNGYNDSTEESQLVAGATYTLVKCWLKGFQQDTIDKTGAAQIHQISAQFQVREIL